MKKSLRFMLALAVASMLLLSAFASVSPPDSVNLVKNGSFEAPVISGGNWNVYDATETNWNISWVYNGPVIPKVELQNGSTVSVVPVDGSQYAELDSDYRGQTVPQGIANQPSVAISQKIETVPNGMYLLTFYGRSRSSNPSGSDDKLRVNWNGQDLLGSPISLIGQWTKYEYTLTAPSNSTVLLFADAGISNSLGTFLDKVELYYLYTPPTARNDAASTTSNVPVNIPILNNDQDNDNGPITVVSVASPTSLGGTIVLNSDNTDNLYNTVAYTPPNGFHGIDTFTYTIQGSKGGTATATVTVTVNAPPTAQDDTVTVPMGTATSINVLANDSDPDNDPLTIQIESPPANGSAIVELDKIVYTPNPGYWNQPNKQPDTFMYTISDGFGGTSTATVLITVPRNNTPPVAVNDDIVAEHNTSTTIHVIANDSDAENDPLTILSNTAPKYGTATIQSNQIVYKSIPGYSGDDTFSYTISDGFGGTATANVRVTVTYSYVFYTTGVSDYVAPVEIEATAGSVAMPQTGDKPVGLAFIVLLSIAAAAFATLFFAKARKSK